MILPVDLYHNIHNYLSHYDYRQFMNCNKVYFHAIKYETVYIDLIGMKYWKKEMRLSKVKYNEEDYENKIKLCLEKLKRNVKNSYKQIGLAQFLFENNDVIESYSNLLINVEFLQAHFNFETQNDSFPSSLTTSQINSSLEIFSTIYQVEFANFPFTSLNGLAGRRSTTMSDNVGGIHILNIFTSFDLNDINEINYIPTVNNRSNPLLLSTSRYYSINKD
jgi:hypothetical protein